MDWMDQIEWCRNWSDRLDKMEKEWIEWVVQKVVGMGRMDWIEWSRDPSDGLDRMEQQCIGWIG